MQKDIRDVGSIPGLENPLEEGMTTHSSVLAWRIPWSEEPGRLQSMRLWRVGHDWNDLAWLLHARNKAKTRFLLFHSLWKERNRGERQYTAISIIFRMLGDAELRCITSISPLGEHSAFSFSSWECCLLKTRQLNSLLGTASVQKRLYAPETTPLSPRAARVENLLNERHKD